MAEPAWLILCDHALYDEGGRLSVLGITRRLAGREVPLTLPAFVVAFACHGRSGEHVRFRLTAIAPSGRVRVIGEGDFGIHELEHSVERFFPVKGLQIPEFGRYRFELTIDGRIAGAWLSVEPMAAPSEAVH